MAAPLFKGVIRLYRLPPGDLIEAELPASARGDWRGNGAAYRYNADKTLGYFFSEDDLELVDEIVEPDGLFMKWEADRIGSWSMTLSYPPDSPIAAELLANIRPSLVERPRIFAVMKAVSVDDEDTSDDFEDILLANVIAQPSAVATGDAADGIVPPAQVGDMPAWTRRGMSGIPLDISHSRDTDGQHKLYIRGADWLWALQSTTHHRDISDLDLPAETLADVQQDRPVPLQKLLSWMLTANAVYTLSDLGVELYGTEGTQGTQTYRVELEPRVGGGAASPGTLPTSPADSRRPAAPNLSGQQAAGSSSIITPIGRHCIGILAPQTASNINELVAGGHNTLQTLQRYVEANGKWLDGRGNLLRVRELGDETAPSVVWEAEDMYDPELSDSIPKATVILTKHPDWRRDWTIYSAVPHLTDVYGHIQQSNVSVAPKPQSYEEEPFYDPALSRSEVIAAGDRLIINHIKAQNEAEALEAADNLSGTCMLRWGDGTRFGIDFDVGDAVELRLGQHDAFSTRRGDRHGLIVRSVALAMDGNTRWGLTIGLGAKADIAPQLNPGRVAMPTKPKPRQPRPTAPTGVGVDPVPPSPPLPPPPGGQTPPLWSQEDIDRAKRPPIASDPDFDPVPFDPGRETIPGTGEPPLVPFDPGRETIPGTGEPPLVPHDPSREVIPGTGEPPAPPKPRSDYPGLPKAMGTTEIPSTPADNPAAARSKGTSPPKTPPKRPKQATRAKNRRREAINQWYRDPYGYSKWSNWKR